MEEHKMAILTHQTYLYSGATALALTKLIDIKDFPALIEPAEAVETTTLSDLAQTYIKGIKSSGGQLDFTANFTGEAWDAAATRVATDTFFELRLSDGSVFEFQGAFDLSLSEGGVNAPVEMVVSVYPSSAITKKAE